MTFIAFAETIRTVQLLGLPSKERPLIWCWSLEPYVDVMSF